MTQKIVKTGSHSLAVTIPAPFVHSLGIKAGDRVVVEPHVDSGVVYLRFTGAVQLHLPTSMKTS